LSLRNPRDLREKEPRMPLGVIVDLRKSVGAQMVPEDLEGFLDFCLLKFGDARIAERTLDLRPHHQFPERGGTLAIDMKFTLASGAV